MHFPGLGGFRFDRRGRHVEAFPARRLHEAVIRDVYRRSVVPMVAQIRGREVLHASAVVGGAGSIVFCGLSGAGKSTIAYALSRRGYRQQADDCVAIERVDGEFRAIGFPFAVRLRRGPARYFGQPAKQFPPSLLQLTRPRPATSSPIEALFVLDRTKARSGRGAISIRPLSASEFFTAVLPHAYCFSLRDPVRKRRMIRQYLDLGSAVPTFRLRYGSGLANLGTLLDRIEETVGRL